MTPIERAIAALGDTIVYAQTVCRIAAALTEAVEEERRACAEIARNPRLAPYTEGARFGGDMIPLNMREHIAQAIEARGKKP